MRLFVFIAILFSFPYICNAGYIGKELQVKISSTGLVNDIPVIVYFKNDVKNTIGSGLAKANSMTSLKEKRRVRRNNYISSLKLHAKNSNQQCKNLLRQYNKNVERDLWLVNAISIKIPSYLISVLSKLPQVDRIVLDSEIRLLATTSGAVNVPLWNHEMIKTPMLWDEGITGKGIVIASMDVGVDATHPDLQSSWRGGTNSWYDPYLQYDLPHDGSGHGTQVMGLMLGGNASGDQIGVAPDAKWISVKIFRDDSTASLSAIHDGFQWLLDPDGDPQTDDAPDIVNNSWGLPAQACSTVFHADIDALKLAGIEVVFAAGNTGPLDGTLFSPSDYAKVLSVGAVDQFMSVARFSSRGPSACSTGFFPNLVAPGVGVYTTDLSSGLGLLLDPYTTVEGTSFSAPHITGVIALLKSAVPSASYDNIRSALYATAVDIGVPGADNASGYGLVDAHSALMRLRCPAGVVDQDADGWYDSCDNCISESNKLQIDVDNDGYGNACDGDLNNDGAVNIGDITLFKEAFFGKDPVADFDEDGKVNLNDLSAFRSFFFGVPGPSALVQ